MPQPTEKPTQQKGNNNAPSSQLTQERATKSNAIEIPQISLPKGGGAIRGIDEKFQVNPVNGTSSFSIPLPLSPNRNGFTPQMSLSYNSGVGNGLFGIGWDIDLPSIQRRTDKKLPRYFDTNNTEGVAKEDSFMFSGVEELVPYLDYKEAPKTWELRQFEDATHQFIIRPYRPRIEGGFSRIERIYHKDQDYYYWRVTSNGNITTFFGYTEGCRIADPTDKLKVFQWLPEFSYDDKGSWVWYDYKTEDLQGVDNDVYEKNRFKHLAEFSNKHIKRIKYGNEKAYYLKDNQNPYIFNTPENENYFFELVFDYGEHDKNNPKTNDNGIWTSRADAFSSYRSCFEIRTYRLCKRVLMFHTFPNDEAGKNRLNNGQTTLVRSIDFDHALSVDQKNQIERPTEFNYLTSITQTGYIWRNNNAYVPKSLPKMTFDYQWLKWNTDVKEVTSENLVHAPVGLSGNYQWTDLYNEGINGILTEQANGWFYKSNLGENTEGGVQFSHAQPVMPKPSFMGLSNGTLQLQDLDTNGEKQLVVNLEGVQGYFELTDEGEWQPFKAFLKTLNLDLRDPNVRMLDVNGDGKPEVVLSDLGAFWFWENQGKIGYDAPELAIKPYDEEQGAAMVFSDFEQRIFLADMSGDGLTDIVRIRNGEVCYWANMGYGRFSAKVTMSNSPVFDHPDMFNPSYIQLADISGTGATDIIYLGKNTFKAYINFSGNAWSDATEIKPFFPTEKPNTITITDLLGNGTACLVWSSALPAYSAAPMRYMDLMGGKKPHIMVSHDNGFGKKTEVEYKSSTYFYLKDKLAGTPWITKLPFPVHCVSRTIITEGVTNLRFTNQYSYHHGYYDHAEREFRGFERVEQTDTEVFDVLERTDAVITSEEHHQPPILTKTWFHTGAFLDKERILKQYEKEYWYNLADKPDLKDDVLDDAFIDFPNTIKSLTAEEAREAARTCKGMALRQEVFGIDGSDKEKIPYTVATHTCFIRPLQPRLDTKNAVFIVLESEAINFSYERNPDDARVAHSMNLEIDQYAQVKKAVSIVYGRDREKHSLLLPYNFKDSAVFQDAHQGILDSEQHKTHVILTETDFTINDLTTDAAFYRLPLPYQVKTFECQGTDFNKQNGFFTKDEIINALIGLPEKPYQTANTVTGKRLIEHIQTLFRSNDLERPLDLGELQSLAMPWEAYQLAFTPDILRGLYGDKLPNDKWADIIETQAKFEKINGNYWISSGKPIFIKGGRDLAKVKSEFYQPIAFEDPFEIKTHVELGDYTLFIKEAIDAKNNTTSVEQFDFRTLSPVKMKDINDNFSEVVTDALGMVVATAIYGKNGEGDTLTGGDWVFTQERINAFFLNPHGEAAGLLKNASACMIYDLNTEGGTKPSRVASIVRETHFKTIDKNGNLVENPNTKYQISIEYSDGLGNVALKKVQAEKNKDGLPQWIGNGRTVLNNKGKPIKQYEPYFSTIPDYENEDEEFRNQGVTPIIFYDGIGRNIKTELPDKTFTKVEFDAWEQRSFDPNDTVLDSEWYVLRMSNNPIDVEKLEAKGKDPVKEKQAAKQAAIHYNTPSIVYLDSLGRPFFSVEHNKWNKPVGNNTVLTEEFYPTYVDLDIEGNVQRLIDARDNTVMTYNYDMLGHRVYQFGMDNGERWLFNDCMGKPLYAWDVNTVGAVNQVRQMQKVYDTLHRPANAFLSINEGEKLLIEHTEYGEDAPNEAAFNLRGQMIKHQDGSGQIENIRFDFKGNLLETHKQMLDLKEVKRPIVHWNNIELENEAQLDDTVYKLLTEYDALNRMTKLYNWHYGNINDAALYEPTYSDRGVLLSENFTLKGETKTVIRNIEYDAKGQRTRMQQGDNNGTITTTTRYQYDVETFRLMQLRTTRHNPNPNNDPDFPEYRSNLLDNSVLQQLVYTYDPVGNIIEIEDQAYEPVFFSNQQVEPKSTYTYDALYRLIEAKGRENFNATQEPKGFGAVGEMANHNFGSGDKVLRNYTQRYEYDAVGNFIKMQHIAHRVDNQTNVGSWTRYYQTAADSNRLIKTSLGRKITEEEPEQRVANGDILYRYDVHGNMLNFSNTPTDNDWDYRDMIGHLNLTVGAATCNAYYQYCNDKQRSRKFIDKGNIKEERLYLGGMERYRRWENNNAEPVEEIETHHLFNGEQRILIVEDVITTPPLGAGGQNTEGVLYRYQYSNHLGSAALELNGEGAIISYEEYHPYGTTAYQAKNADIKCAAKRYRYTGMERDEESGLAYHTARYYLPWLGRWGSADPIGVEGGMNLYGYVESRPINIIDKQGEDGNVGEIISKTAEQLNKQLLKSAGKGIATGTEVGTTVGTAGGGIAFAQAGLTITALVVAVDLYAIRTNNIVTFGNVWGVPRPGVPNFDFSNQPTLQPQAQLEPEVMKPSTVTVTDTASQPQPDENKNKPTQPKKKDEEKKKTVYVYRAMATINGSWIPSPLKGAPNGTQLGARTVNSNPSSIDISLDSNNQVAPSTILSPESPEGLSAQLTSRGGNIDEIEDRLKKRDKPGAVGRVTLIELQSMGLMPTLDPKDPKHFFIQPGSKMDFNTYQTLLNNIPWQPIRKF